MKQAQSTGLISVIVPCYNVERYLKQCLRSILHNTYTNLEVICVNDGSNDSTPAILNKFAAKDKRVKVISQANQGVSVARYNALKAATGEFVAFVDGDDWIHNNAFEILHNAMVKYDADVVEAGYKRVMDRWGLIASKKRIAPFLLVEGKDIMSKYYFSFFGRSGLATYLCMKLFKRQLLEDTDCLQPSDYKMQEDFIASFKLFPHLNRYVRIPQCVYYYRWGGTTSHLMPFFYSDLKKIYYLKTAEAAKYKDRFNFNQALNSSKIEMCNVTYTEIVQRLRFGLGRQSAKEFLQGEIESGFVKEITDGVEYSHLRFHLLKELKVDQLIDLAQKEVDSQKFKYRIMGIASKLFN